MESQGREKLGEKRVLGRYVVYQGNIKVPERQFDPMVGVVLLGNVG